MSYFSMTRLYFIYCALVIALLLYSYILLYVKRGICTTSRTFQISLDSCRQIVSSLKCSNFTYFIPIVFFLFIIKRQFACDI